MSKKRIKSDERIMKLLHLDGLKEGKFTVIDGIVTGFRPKTGPEIPLVAGFPLKYSKSLGQAIAEVETSESTFDEMVASMKKVVTILAEYYGQHLPPDNMDQLRLNYTKTVERSMKINQDLIGEEGEVIVANIESARKELANIMTDMILEELRIFAGHPEAQVLRYKKWKGKNLPNLSKLRVYLLKEYEDFLNGEYLKKDAKVIKKKQNQSEQKSKKKGAFVNPPPVAIQPELMGTFEPPTPGFVIRERMVRIDTFGYDVRIFYAYHPVTGDPGGFWEDLTGTDLGLDHTGVVAGLWKLVKQRQLRSVVDPTTGTIYNESKYTILRDEWQGWICSNSAAGEFESYDDLVQVGAARYFPTSDKALQFAMGATATPDDKIRPVRACAYSAGLYGIHWLCHQCCNAFSSRKWGFHVVFLPSNVIFGSTGRFYWPIAGPVPVSKRECPVWGRCCFAGGIPGGENLFFIDAPPYGPNLLDGFFYGYGHGLGLFYHHIREKWYPSRAHFSLNPVPFDASGQILEFYDGWDW